jgi:hypothetical protein
MKSCEVMHTERPELLHSDWILHHDNAPANKVLSVKQFQPPPPRGGTPTLFPWFGSEWLLVVSKNKVYLKGTKVSGYWTCPPPPKSDDSTESYSATGIPRTVHNSGSIVGLSSQLLSCSRGVLQRWPLSVSCRYTCMLAIKLFRALHSHTSYALQQWVLQ